MTSQNPSDHFTDTEGDRDVSPGADDMPTPDVEEAADRAAETAPDVSEPYTEMAERGAKAKGEGRIDE